VLLGCAFVVWGAVASHAAIRVSIMKHVEKPFRVTVSLNSSLIFLCILTWKSTLRALFCTQNHRCLMGGACLLVLCLFICSKSFILQKRTYINDV